MAAQRKIERSAKEIESSVAHVDASA